MDPDHELRQEVLGPNQAKKNNYVRCKDPQEHINFKDLSAKLVVKNKTMSNQCLEQLRPLQHVRIEREHLLEVNVYHPR